MSNFERMIEGLFIWFKFCIYSFAAHIGILILFTSEMQTLLPEHYRLGVF